MESGDDIKPYIEGIQYAINGHMEDVPDFIRWHYSEPGRRKIQSTRDLRLKAGLTLISMPALMHWSIWRTWNSKSATLEGTNSKMVH
jgi:hypothetical protein